MKTSDVDEKYESLAGDFIEHVSGFKGKKSKHVRLCSWLLQTQKSGISLHDLAASLLAPRPSPRASGLLTVNAIRKNLSAPLLKKLRGDRTLIETAQILGLKTFSSYGHWENARRDIPLPAFLKAVDLLSGRLQAFCETSRFEKNLADYDLQGKKDFALLFFKYPWVPTLFLALQITAPQKLGRSQLKSMLMKLGVDPKLLDEGLSVLLDLELIRWNQNEYEIRKGYFYSPPNLDAETLLRLNGFWFSKSLDLFLNAPGLHKLDQFTLPRASLPKISEWISELREKIRLESKMGDCEKVVHFQWQMAELIPDPKTRSST